MRTKKTIGRGFGVGALVEELPAIRATLEAMRDGKIRPEQFHNVQLIDVFGPLAERILELLTVATRRGGREDLLVTELKEWPPEALAKMASRALDDLQPNPLLPPDLRKRCADLADMFRCDGGELHQIVTHFFVYQTAEREKVAEISATLEAMKVGKIKPEQLNDVGPITEGLLVQVAYREGLTPRLLENWTADELADAAAKALKLVNAKGGRSQDEAARWFVDELLGLWLAAGNAFPPNPSASSEMKEKPAFHKFVEGAAKLVGIKTFSRHQISEAIKARSQ